MKANYKSSSGPKPEKVNHAQSSKKDVKNLNKKVNRAKNARIISNYKKAKWYEGQSFYSALSFASIIYKY